MVDDSDAFPTDLGQWFDSDGLGNNAVYWEVSSDPNMKQIIKRCEAVAAPQLAHSVHVDLQGIDPNKDYWYQFSVSKYKSEIGRTNTLPSMVNNPDSIRFVTASCQNYIHGHFVAYDHIVEENPDFVIFLADYIYDKSFGQTVRKHNIEKAPSTLEEYRQRHALYKYDKHLKKAHAKLPFFCT